MAQDHSLHRSSTNFLKPFRTSLCLERDARSTTSAIVRRTCSGLKIAGGRAGFLSAGRGLLTTGRAAPASMGTNEKLVIFCGGYPHESLSFRSRSVTAYFAIRTTASTCTS